MQFALSLVLFSWLCAQLASAHTIKYVYSPQYAAGIRGWFQVRYWDVKQKHSTYAHIQWKLDFSRVDPHALLMADGNCTAPVTMYMWHIHVKWSANHTSEAFKQCSLALAGNHYDPLHACGPNSEFAGTPVCANKTGQYMCTPAKYAHDPLVCEKGDLSGKFGAIKLNWAKQSSGEVTDRYYPSFEENTPQWNIVLHAMCGKATPRVACAVGQLVHYKGDGDNMQQPMDGSWHEWSRDGSDGSGNVSRMTEEVDSSKSQAEGCDEGEDANSGSGTEANSGEDGGSTETDNGENGSSGMNDHEEMTGKENSSSGMSDNGEMAGDTNGSTDTNSIAGSGQ